MKVGIFGSLAQRSGASTERRDSDERDSNQLDGSDGR
jgi:hypothetical protein